MQSCLEAYALVRHEKRLADRALDVTLRSKRHLYANERRAVAEHVYALLRRLLTVDFLLERSRPGWEKLIKGQQDLLRLGLSRVLHGESPANVSRALGLVGSDAAALEKVPDGLAAIERLPAVQRYSVRASLPLFLAEKLLAELGDEAAAAADAMNVRAPLTARANALKGDREELMATLRADEIDTRPTPLSPLGVFLETRVNAFSLDAFKAGLFELQDEGSQLLGMLVEAPVGKVVDACAGAGGKTLQLAAQMKNRGELFALDIDEGRLDEMRRRCRRADVHNVRTRVIPSDPAQAITLLSDLKGHADRVLVDAPCSGSGTFRRKPDARYRLTPDDLRMHIARQQSLLDSFSELVRPGGRLIYGTCSLLREENEAVVERFLATHPAFSVRNIAEALGRALADKISRDGFLRLMPHRHGTDGFFGAVLVRAR